LADFKTALQALARGELKREVLIKNLEKLLAKSPRTAEKILQQLREAYGSDMIDAQTYASLKKRVQELSGVAVGDTGGDAQEATQFAGGDRTVSLTEAEREAIAAEARSSTHLDPTTGDSTSNIDFDLSAPQSSTADSAFDPTGSGATGTGFAKPAGGAAEAFKIGPNTILKERFRLIEVLGVGGMGTVYRGVDLLKEEARDRNPYVALKVLNEDFKEHPDSFIALQREASRQQKLAHPNIATIYDFDRTGSTVYITMELMEGIPLNTYIKKTVRPRGGLPMEEAFPLIQGMGNALIYAHERKIVHSDFKPGNCFLLNDGTMKILDFGIARAVKNPLAGEAEKTLFDPGKLGALTPAYASAEMLEGEDPDPRDDIYALACVAYELLTGKHPFNKLPANTARDNKLLPAPIKGLKRRQMKGLARGLAFNREDRSQTVREFVEEVEGKSYWYKNPFVITGAAAAVIALVAIQPTLGYLHKKRIDGYVADLASGDAGIVNDRLCMLPRLVCPDRPEITKLDEEDQTQILATPAARDGIQGHYDAVIKARVEAKDFPTADRLVKDLELLYPDSRTVEEIRYFVENNRNILENQLNQRFIAHLDSGTLLADQAADDLGDVLAEIKQVDPRHPLLTDARISAAYSKQADAAILALDFERAQTLVDAGLGLIGKFAPGKKDVNLINLADKIRNVRETEADKALIARLESRLEEAAPTLDQLAAWKAVQADVTQLALVAPDSAVLDAMEAKARPLIQSEIRSIRENRDWVRVGPLKDDYASLLSALHFDNELRQLEIEHNDFNRRADGLLVGLAAAVAEGRLAPPAADNATALLADMARTVPNSPQLAEARDALAHAQLRAARQQRAAGDLDAARQHLARAAQIEVSATLAAALEAEQAAIADAGRVAALSPAEHEARIAPLATALDQQLAAFDGSPESAREAFAALDALEAADPTNGKIAQARERIGEAIAAAALAAGEAGNWNQGLARIRDGLAMLPESARLTAALSELQTGAQEAIASGQEQLIADARNQIATLLADPKLDRDWDKALQAEFNKVEPLLPATDPWLAETSREVAQLYASRAAQMREEQRFTEATRLLDVGAEYAPEFEAIVSERQTLARAEQAFEQARQQELAKAELEGLKQTFLTQAKAREVTGAKATLERLKPLLPTDDPFLARDVPGLMGDAYLKLAEERAKGGNFLAALNLAKEGAGFAPNMSALKQVIRNYTTQGNAEALRKIFGAATELDVADVQGKLSEIQLLDPQVHATLSRELADALAGRILALADPDPAAARRLKDQGLELFPGNSRIEGVQIMEPGEPPAPALVAAIDGFVREGKLTEAESTIKLKADATVKAHPAFKRSDQALQRKRSEAEKLSRTAIELQQAGKFDDALDRAKSAQKIWTDWREIDILIKQLEEQIKSGATVSEVGRKDDWSLFEATSDFPCTALLAGHGKRKKGACFDYVLKDGKGEKKSGPYLVVVPAGSGIETPFAIGKYEVTRLDYARYCDASGACSPPKLSRETASLPMTGISVEDARKYAAWLSDRTGSTYRLPTAAEWAYAAQSGGDQPKKDYNCRLEQGGQVLKGQGLMGVNTGKPNGWGLYNYVGNVQELTTDGGGVVARGGMYQDSYSKCDISLERSHDGAADEVTGFRVVKELG
jgi:serine/threonine protein kinase